MEHSWTSQQRTAQLVLAKDCWSRQQRSVLPLLACEPGAVTLNEPCWSCSTLIPVVTLAQ